MEQIETYILRTKEERQKHLKLDEACIERGGNSSYCRGLLAHIHDTSIPSGKKIHVCHACHNAKCSNPWHLYWGTSSENRRDFTATGQDKSIWERSVEKHGLQKAKEINSQNAIGNKNGSGNAGNSKSEEHKNKISKAISEKYETFTSLGGRKRALPYEDIINIVKEKGFKDAAIDLGLSVAALKGRYYNAIKALNNADVM